MTTSRTEPASAREQMAADARVDTRPRRNARATFHPLTVAEIQPLTEDSAAITFNVPDELREAFSFHAGQSVTLRRTIDGIDHRRTYSICAPTGAQPHVGVREIPQGLFSSWLVHDLKVGDTVEVQTPTGAFQTEPATAGRHLCIAAGSGITPMLSIASSVLANPASKVTLLYGNRTTRSVMFSEELADLKNRHGARLDLIHVLSREPRDVELFSGRLDADRLRRLLPLLVPLQALDHVWICGPFGLVADAREVLAELHVPQSKVHVELFYVDEPPPELSRQETPIDADSSSMVTVVLDGRASTTPMAKNRTILDSATLTRSDLPFACKGGVCGTCRAQVTSGQVDMRRNYALDEDEVSRDYVLTCQTYPVGDTVTVDFDS